MNNNFTNIQSDSLVSAAAKVLSGEPLNEYFSPNEKFYTGDKSPNAGKDLVDNKNISKNVSALSLAVWKSPLMGKYIEIHINSNMIVRGRCVGFADVMKGVNFDGSRLLLQDSRRRNQWVWVGTGDPIYEFKPTDPIHTKDSEANW
jgi:hypothetical protein